MSKKRQKESRVYAVKRRAFLEAKPICEICLHRPSAELHHVSGRYSDTYLNEETWLATCTQCHRDTHRNPALAKELGYIKSHTVSPGLKP